MKKVFLLVMSALLCVGVANAQDDNKTKKEKKSSKIGSFLKKTVEASTGLNVSDEVYVTYDEKGFVKDRMEVEFVGCYGDSHTGNVYTILRVKANQNDEVYLGLGKGVTAKGKMYKCNKSSYGYTLRDVSKGHWVEVNLEDTPLSNVPTDVKTFEVLTFETAGYWFNIHNVPIQWDVKPE